MSINRQQRRGAQRRDERDVGDGLLPETGDDVLPEAGEDGLAASSGGVGVATEEVRVQPAPPAPASHRVGPRQFLHEVNVEMRKVAWPTKGETANYSTVVFISLAIIMAFIFGLDLAFSKAASLIFGP